VAATIFEGRDNGTTVFSVNDGGYLTAAVTGAGNARWGVPAASPQAYAHRLAADSRAGVDEDVAGANAIIAPSVGTGDAAGSTLTVQTPTAGASGTGAQTLTTRAVFSAKGVNIPGLAQYADNTAAVAGGLVTGDLYRTAAGVLMVVLP
jgi:hypothetical protein